LIANILGTDRHIESLKIPLSTTTPSTLGQRNLVNFGPQTTELKWLILTNPSGHFSGDYISAIRGLLLCQIFARARDWSRLPSAHPNWDGGPPKKILIVKILKFGLKFSVWATITLGLVGVSSWNFFQPTCRRAGVITRVQFSEGPPLKFVRTKQPPKFGAMFDNFRLWSRLSSERIIMSKVGKYHYQLQPLPRWAKKFGELWSTNNRVKVAHIDQPKWTFFGRLHFGH